MTSAMFMSYRYVHVHVEMLLLSVYLFLSIHYTCIWQDLDLPDADRIKQVEDLLQCKRQHVWDILDTFYVPCTLSTITTFI